MHDQTMRVVPQPMRRQVEEGLRAAIINGRFLPGEHLPDRVLCDLFGASRGVVREAVRLLEAEGLIVVQPHRGPFVAFISAAEAAQIYEVRAVLEALAGEGFAIRASDEERAELKDIFEELKTVSPQAGKDVLLGIKSRFYDVLLRGSRNEYAKLMLNQILNRNSQLRATSLADPKRLPNVVKEIQRVMDEIDQRDDEGAFQACREYVISASKVTLRLLREREQARVHTSKAAEEIPSNG